MGKVFYLEEQELPNEVRKDRSEQHRLVTQKAFSHSMDTAFRGGGSGLLLQLLNDTPRISDPVAHHPQITSEWIEHWKTTNATAQSLVNLMSEKISEIDALMTAQSLAPHSEDLKKEIMVRRVDWDKYNVELLKGIVFKKFTEIETLHKEVREKETEVEILRRDSLLLGAMTRKAEDDKFRIESLENQLAEKSKAAELLEARVRTLTRRLKEEEFLMNMSRRKVVADEQSEEAYKLECDIIFESFRAVFLDAESRYVEPSETPLTSVDGASLATGGQSEDPDLSIKLKSDQPEQPGDVTHQVEVKRMKDSEHNEDTNDSMKLEGELEMLTLEQYRDAISKSTEKKKRSQPVANELQHDQKFTKKVRR